MPGLLDVELRRDGNWCLLTEVGDGTRTVSFRIVVKPHTAVRRVFDAIGLSQVFPLYPTVSTAVAGSSGRELRLP